MARASRSASQFTAVTRLRCAGCRTEWKSLRQRYGIGPRVYPIGGTEEVSVDLGGGPGEANVGSIQLNGILKTGNRFSGSVNGNYTTTSSENNRTETAPPGHDGNRLRRWDQRFGGRFSDRLVLHRALVMGMLEAGGVNANTDLGRSPYVPNTSQQGSAISPTVPINAR